MADYTSAPYPQQAPAQVPQRSQPQQPYPQQVPPTPRPPAPLPTPPQQPGRPFPVKALAITALVCGIVAIVASWTVIGGILLGATALVCGILVLLRGKNGLAIAGVSCGGAALLASVILLATGLSVFGRFRVVRVRHSSPDTTPVVLSVRTAVCDRLANAPVLLTDDNNLAFDITEVELDRDGNLLVHFTMKNHSSADYLYFYDPAGLSWTVNDREVDPVLSEVLYEKEFRAGWFFVPADQLPTFGDLRDVFSIHGTIRCDVVKDGTTTTSVDYQLAL